MTLGFRPCVPGRLLFTDIADPPVYTLRVSLPSRGVRGAFPLLESPVELAGLSRRAKGRVGGATGDKCSLLTVLILFSFPPLGATELRRPLLPLKEGVVGVS